MIEHSNKTPELLALEDKDRRTNLKKFCNSILQKIGELDNYSGDRAIWELCQNARDLSDGADIKITLDGISLTFAHKGNPFNEDSLLSLVKQVSSEEKENAETAGQFGTGFVTTHYFSRKFYLNGSFRTSTGKVFDLNRFEIDRSEDDVNKFIEIMDNQIQSVYKLLSNPESQLREWTELIYPLTAETKAIALRAMHACEKMLPEVLVLNDRIKTVTLEYKLNNVHKNIVFTKGRSYQEEDLNIQEILLCEDGKSPSTISVYFLQTDCKRIILPLENERHAKSHEDKAKLFIWFPLLGTEEWGTNFIYHSSFYPLEKRNGIVLPCENPNQQKAYEYNVAELERMNSILFDYLKKHITEIDNSIELAKINFPCHNEDEKTQDFYRIQQQSWASFFRTLPLIDTPAGRKSLDEGVKIPNQEICHFFVDEEMRGKYFDAFYHFASTVTTLPLKDECLRWANIIHQWNLPDIQQYEISLAEVAKKASTEGNLIELHNFLEIIKKINQITLFKDMPLIPNRSGILKTTESLWDGKDIPEELYRRALPICREDMDKLVHPDFADIYKLNEYTREHLRSAVYSVHDNLKLSTLKIGKCFSEEYTTALRRFVSIYPVENPDSHRHQIMQALSKLKGFEYKVCCIPRSEEKDTKDYYRSAFIFLMESELLGITIAAQRDPKWLTTHKEDLLDLISKVGLINDKDDSLRLLGNNGYAVIPNQEGQLCKLEDLRIRENNISDELSDLYTNVLHQDLRTTWIDTSFVQFISPEKTDSAKSLALEIERVLMEEYETSHEVSKYIIDIIQKIESKTDEAPLWKEWFKRINEKKADLNWHIVPEESKSNFYRLMKVANNKELLEDLAEMSENTDILRKFKDFLAKHQQEEAEFKFKHDLGKHIENMIRLKLNEELCTRVNVTTTIEDQQGGQDIVIQLDGKDIYFIECKAKWNFSEPAHMSKLQIRKACDEKGHYALCAVDLTSFKGLSNGVFPLIEQIERHIHIHFDVAEKLATVTEHLFAIDEESDETRMTISADYRSNIPKSVFVNNIGFDSLIDAIINRIHTFDISDLD